MYIHKEEIHNDQSAREVVPLLIKLIGPKSVLDVGCGIGTWLKVFHDKGIHDLMGIDGDYVDRNLLSKYVDENLFEPKDLSKPFNLGKKFDLVVSLEVAEHLPDSVSDDFVTSLITHSDTIVFSAATPGQSGQNHINEQWPDYWQKKFLHHGYQFYDVIRPWIWYNEKVQWWYRQNMFLVTKNDVDPTLFKKLPVIGATHFEKTKEIISMYENQLDHLRSGRSGVKTSAKVFVNALKNMFKNLWKRN